MPELPEVEVIRRQLCEVLVGRRIVDCRVSLSKAFTNHTDEPAAPCGECVVDVRRRGKYLLLDTDRAHTLIVHLRMTGALFYDAVPTERTHVRVRLALDNGAALVFRDIRTFGSMHLWPTAEAASLPSLASLGPEPAGAEWTEDYLYTATRRRTAAIKTILLNQQLVAGIGNIYADESLFAARIRPTRAAGRLSRAACARLCTAVREVLAAAVVHGGTSFRDYRDSNGARGDNVRYLQVYGRGGEDWRRCGNVLRKVRVGGRATVYCPQCQR